MYPMLKHFHLTFVGITVILFLLRFFWLQRQSPMLQKKWVKIVPHINDTLLLISAIALIVYLGIYPFQTAWLTDKLVGLVGYIVFAAIALKARQKLWQWFGFVVAMGWLAVLFHVATSKQAIMFG